MAAPSTELDHSGSSQTPPGGQGQQPSASFLHSNSNGFFGTRGTFQPAFVRADPFIDKDTLGQFDHSVEDATIIEEPERSETPNMEGHHLARKRSWFHRYHKLELEREHALSSCLMRSQHVENAHAQGVRFGGGENSPTRHSVFERHRPGHSGGSGDGRHNSGSVDSNNGDPQSEQNTVRSFAELRASGSKHHEQRYRHSLTGAATTQFPLEIVGSPSKAAENQENSRVSSLSQLNAQLNAGRSQTRNIEDTIFDLYKDEETGRVHVGDFLTSLANTGIRRTDPRLKQFLRGLREKCRQKTGRVEPIDILHLDHQSFVECIGYNIVFINRLLRSRITIPDWFDFCSIIDDITGHCEQYDSGNVASYIPQLARVNPAIWCVSICTVSGQRHTIGDHATEPFCVQSVSKVLNYCKALNDHGSDEVHKFVGQEPSGRIFNDLVLDHTNRPHNPLINAGAIAVCSLLERGQPQADRYENVINFYKKMAGNEFVGFNNSVFLSERATADRNYALAYYMRENNVFPTGTDLQETMDFYFQLCAVEVTVESGALMAATLANGGICPTTEEPVLDGSCVRDVLSLMHSCGMYDYSGQFAFKIGLPAKSGVSGAIFVVVPKVMGICLWSPPLDRYGNSVRGIKFCEQLVKRFNFHNYDNIQKFSERKVDPRQRALESKGQQIVNVLFSAANGDVTALRRYHLQGIDLAMRDYDSRTALHLAAAEGHLGCVRFLVDKVNVEPNVQDRWGRTPRDEAVSYGHQEVLSFLDMDATQRRLVEQQLLESSENEADVESDSGLDSDRTRGRKNEVAQQPRRKSDAG